MNLRRCDKEKCGVWLANFCCCAVLLSLLLTGCGEEPNAATPSDQAQPPTADSRSETSATSSQVVVERVTTIRETTTRQTRKASQEPVVAIFIKNRAGDDYNDKVAVLEDLLSARLAEAGFTIQSREDVINSVASFAGAGPNAGDPNLAGAELDALLSNNTSALRLAQNMGADYLLTASIVSINHNKKRLQGYGVDRTVFESVLRASYKVLDRVKGGSVTGGTVKSIVKSPFQDMPTNNALQNQMNSYAEQIGAVDDLLDDASAQLAAHLTKRREQVQEPTDDAGTVAWTVICGTTDLLVPTIVKDEAGEFVLGEHKLPVNPTNVTVELNGVVVGTAPGTFEVPPGLSKMRLSREGYRAIEQTVNVADGQTLRIDLHMTDKEYLRWKDMIAFMETLKIGAKLTDAQAEAVRGYAQMLRQSGFKVNIDSDLKGVVKYSIW